LSRARSASTSVTSTSFDVGVVRDAALRLLHLLRDLAAQADDLDVVRRVGRCRRARRRYGPRAGAAARDVGIEVGLDDPARRAGGGDAAQVDPELPGARANRG
jgi:hypothetical protein